MLDSDPELMLLPSVATPTLVIFSDTGGREGAEEE